MREYELIAPCHFGLEAVLKRELADLGLEISHVEDGRVTFKGDARAICRANIGLRTAERILLQAGTFTACSYDELFEKTKALPWEQYLPRDAKVWVAKATTIKSRLYSPSDIQSIMKKAIVERLKSAWHTEIIPENGAAYPLRVFAMKDVFTVGLDTTGTDSLHKRGYRKSTTKAPISETLAAALLMLTPWKKDRILVDPFCGSGTFIVEAALMAAGIAPGAYRHFQAESWKSLVPEKIWQDTFQEARSKEDRNVKTFLSGYDIDPDSVRMAQENAERAGISHLVHFGVRDVRDFSESGSYGFIVTNPPYGERLEEKEALPALYRALGDSFRRLDNWSLYVITSFDQTENCIGRKADKNRKIYNGMIQTYFYQFVGEKPPKKLRETEEIAADEAEKMQRQPEAAAEEKCAEAQSEALTSAAAKPPAVRPEKDNAEPRPYRSSEARPASASGGGSTVVDSKGRRLVIKNMDALKKRLERPARKGSSKEEET